MWHLTVSTDRCGDRSDDGAVDQNDGRNSPTNPCYPTTQPFNSNEGETSLDSQIPEIFFLPETAVDSQSVEESTGTQPFTVSSTSKSPIEDQDSQPVVSSDDISDTAARTGSADSCEIAPTQPFTVTESNGPAVLSLSPQKTNMSDPNPSANPPLSSLLCAGDGGSLDTGGNTPVSVAKTGSVISHKQFGVGNSSKAMDDSIFSTPRCSTQIDGSKPRNNDELWQASDSLVDVWPSPIISSEEEGGDHSKEVALQSPDTPTKTSQSPSILSGERSCPNENDDIMKSGTSAVIDIEPSLTHERDDHSLSAVPINRLRDSSSDAENPSVNVPVSSATATPLPLSDLATEPGIAKVSNDSPSSQLSWSSFDFTSQQYRQLSLSSQTSMNLGGKSQPLDKSTKLTPIVACIDLLKHFEWFNIGLLDKTRQSVLLYCTETPSQQIDSLQEMTNFTQHNNSSQGISSNVNTQEVIDLLVSMNSSGSTHRDKDTSNQTNKSWSDDGMVVRQSPEPSVLDSPKRKSRLQEIIQQPLKNEKSLPDNTVSPSQSSSTTLYEDCQTRLESVSDSSDSSYHSINSQPSAKLMSCPTPSDHEQQPNNKNPSQQVGCCFIITFLAEIYVLMVY